jgi:hypothetical protein
MWHAWERGETCTGFWWESPKEKDHLKDRGVDGRMGSKWTLGRLVGGGRWSGFTSHSINNQNLLKASFKGVVPRYRNNSILTFYLKI